MSKNNVMNGLTVLNFPCYLVHLFEIVQNKYQNKIIVVVSSKYSFSITIRFIIKREIL